MNNRPTGIIRTLPWYGAEDSQHNNSEKGKAYQRMMRGFESLKHGDGHILIALPSKPKIEVLHLYLIMDGQVRVRGNIAEYLSGDQVGNVACWDDSTRSANWWAVVTGPVSRPPHEMKMRGFQGFRYVGEPLW